MKLTKPICFLDIEGTGVDPAKDRIVTLAVTKLATLDYNGGERRCERHAWSFNPGFQMSDEVIAVHGITNEMVANWPRFMLEHGMAIVEAFDGCDLGGFNLLNYDIPILWEELNRVGIVWNLDGVQIVDSGNIFKKKEERTLSAAVKFYCNRDHAEAHDAQSDVQETINVFEAQLGRYPDLSKMTVAEVAAFSRFDERVDLAGKLVRDKDGDATYAIGKSKGVKVKDDLGFAYWMLGKDFTENTKECLRRIINEVMEVAVPQRDHVF